MCWAYHSLLKNLVISPRRRFQWFQLGVLATGYLSRFLECSFIWMTSSPKLLNVDDICHTPISRRFYHCETIWTLVWVHVVFRRWIVLTSQYVFVSVSQCCCNEHAMSGDSIEMMYRMITPDPIEIQKLTNITTHCRLNGSRTQPLRQTC